LRNGFLFILILLPQLLIPPSASLNNLAFGRHKEIFSFGVSTNQKGLRTSPQPIYVRLQAMQKGSVVFWESIPQSFQDHVATINVSVLAILVSSNARSIDLYKDEVGNLWLAANYTFNEGDYISTLTWVSSETVSENLTIPESVPFPESYPDNITPYLDPGRKMPVDNTTIEKIAKSNATQNMIETIENILDFVNETQTYDREKIKLLMNGTLNTTNILNFLNDPLESLETGNSFCFERALLAATILRAAKVPARTFTNADLKTWIEVWLPDIGWVDAEVLCVQPHHLFPRPLSFALPWMIENSSDAMFPFTWLPEALMRVANLTLSQFEAFNIDEYGTVLSQPVDVEIYEIAPDKFSFPLVFEPEIVQGALTLNGSDITFHLSKGEKNTSKTLILGETNNIRFEGLGVSFKPIRQGDMVILYNFSVKELWTFDVKILIPFVAAVPVILIFWLYWKRKRNKP
jgi:hypothetical protein